MGAFCTHSGMRWDGITHGVLAADERYVSIRGIITCLSLTGARFA